jgi:cytochrome c peroxidase
MRSMTVVALASVLFGAGCGGAESGEEEGPAGEAALAQQGPQSGKGLFARATFGGNGRTCATCHSEATGTVSPAEAQARFDADPSDPLFRALDSDDGTGASYERLLTWATVNVKVPLAPNVTLAGDPAARFVRLDRSVPSTLNTPALDPVLMWDGRAPDLEAQALGAINTHMEPTEQPTDAQLEKIADYEQKLFSSKALKKFADGGPPPELPLGNTESEKRGRLFFVDLPFERPSLHGFCASCHSGPMLNVTNPFNPVQGAGLRFSTALVSDLDPRGIPPKTFLFAMPGGVTATVVSPDPGLALLTGNPAHTNLFKIPTLWNVKNTAPYFHDGSARTLEDVVEQYNQFNIIINQLSFTEQEKADIVAFMKLL